MDSLFSVEALSALLTLSLMEIVLGIDNIIFIAILTSRLPKEKQPLGRNLGISMALITRILLLFSLSWLMGLTKPLFTLFSHGFSMRDLILVGGGLFLVAKATFEIHHKVEGEPEAEEQSLKAKTKNLQWIIIQIMLLDIVFSLDSVITAIGMVKQISIMVIAMIIAMVVMLLSAGRISDFVEKHPTVKILALSFLILIGVVLIVEGMGGHVGKGYIYFAMFFSLCVEMINMRYRSKNS
ncbi:MAG: TerC family protein [Bdellovibrionales bacterium]|nr:TerC family protein [Bdellovibrionales bacterium]NQZ19834.1 TerC family protein [Bdellovibrionales bacterium]